jgi:hypothetical protein
VFLLVEAAAPARKMASARMRMMNSIVGNLWWILMAGNTLLYSEIVGDFSD